MGRKQYVFDGRSVAHGFARVIRAVGFGGDTDTIGAMAGALAGALHGRSWSGRQRGLAED